MITDRPALPAPPPRAPPDAPAPRRVARRARVVIGVLIVGVAWASLPFLGGLLGAVVLAVVAAPLQRRLAARAGRRAAALLITIATAVLLVAPSVLVMVIAVRRAQPALQHVLDSAAFARLSTLHIAQLDVGAQLAESGRNVVAWASGHVMAVVAAVSDVVINLLLALVGLYYLLLDGPALWRRARPYLPFSRDGAEHIAGRFASITESALLGIVATALVQGLTVGIGFRVVGLSHAVFWACITGIVSVLPVLGSSLVWGPGVVVLLLEGRPAAAATLLVIGAVVSSNIDNVVRPLINRRVSGLHPMVSLLGAFAGMKVLGLLGIVLGPLALAYCGELLALYGREYGPAVEP